MAITQVNNDARMSILKCWAPVLLTVSIALISALVTWPAAVGDFIEWMAQEDGYRKYSIPDLLFQVTIGLKDASIVLGLWLLATAVLSYAVFILTRSTHTAKKVSAVVQITVGAIYIVLMAFSTVGLWSK